MPKFIDHHEKLPQMPPEMMQQVAQRLKSGEVDQFGMKGINLFVGDDGQGWCLSEGPSVDAVVKSHAALGVPVAARNVTQVNSVI